jgi:phosphatidylserine/phosphatidylglycerophosphate/cardiolipin synthase-like enzyme
MTIEIRAFANSDDCLVVWNAPAIDGCLGFAIGRERKLPDNKIEPLLLENRVGFKGEPMEKGEVRPSTEWPFQRYDWTDHRAGTGDEVRYCVTPVFRKADGTVEADVSQSSGWTDWVVLSPTAGPVSAYFNRGLVMSQFMARALKGDYSVASLRRFKANLKLQEDKLRIFLGGDLLLKIRSMLDAAKADGQHVYAALYELKDPEVIQLFAALGRRVHMVLANGSDKAGDGNQDANEALEGKIDLHRRMLGSKGLGHNKFIVFTDAKKKPISVWTGSTNLAETGLCTQVNNGVLLEDADVAQAYLKQWKELKKAGDAFPPELKAKNSIVVDFPPKNQYSIQFTPTVGRVDLAYAKKLVDQAQESVLFLMFKPGTKGLLGAVQQARLRSEGLYLYGVINDLVMPVTSGSGESKKTVRVELVSDDVSKKHPYAILEPEGVKEPLATWAAEVTRRDFFGNNPRHPTVGHAIIHAKVIVLDAFGDNPVVITGSHNFSDSASTKNDENMLVIRGNRELAEKYAVEIEAVYAHYRWRSILSKGWIKEAGLDPDDRWQKRKRTPEQLRKMAFWVR